MKLGILKERAAGERRVAATPETAEKLKSLGFEVWIEQGAGIEAGFPDDAYRAAGAEVTKNAAKPLGESDIILKVQAPFENLAGEPEYQHMKSGAVFAGLLDPHNNGAQLPELAVRQISAFSMELIPRISRAQGMDVLSSQANLAGYKAVLDAVSELNKVVPMMMTAAGTVQPAKALILGAGVAGLQAIATAKRLGASVSAFDVRPAVREQVQSLGAKFIEVAGEAGEGQGGYAKEMSKEYQLLQRELIHETLKTQDIVITTALIPGKQAPVLITREMVQDMKDGAVIVDLAVTAGGNCEGAERGKTVKRGGVTIIGHENIPSRLPKDASMLYARNLLNFVTLLLDKKTGALSVNMEDDIIEGSLVTHQGAVVHQQFQKTETGSQKPEVRKKK